MFDVEPAQAAGCLALLCGTDLSLLQGTSLDLPQDSLCPGRTGMEGSLELYLLSLVFAASFLHSLRREKLIFFWGLPFRCCLSFPAEDETDEA